MPGAVVCQPFGLARMASRVVLNCREGGSILAGMGRPNVLYIHSHDTGRYVQPYGHAIPTPNIQRLAEQGVLFRQAFCAAPQCSPSRAALLTGQWAHNTGMLGLAHIGWQLADVRQHLLYTLRDAGYHSALAGMQHVAAKPEDIGYDAVIGDVDDAELRAVEFLNDPPAQPFFLNVGFLETHRIGAGFSPPLDGQTPADPRYTRPPATLPDGPETRRDMAEFVDSAGRLDRRMGVVFHALQSTGLADNTLVICTTDHGIAFPAMKCNLTDHGIGVMLIMRGPGGFAGGKVVDAMVSQVDVFPTLCELLGIDQPNWLQGRSLMPLIRDEADEVRDELFAEVTYHAAYEPMRAVRTRRWKYIRRFDSRSSVVLPNCDDSASKTLWLDVDWTEQPRYEEQLYDLVFDPNEANNLVGREHAASALADMRQRLDRWMRETDDPMLSPPVTLPDGAWASDPDGVSPRAPKEQA